MVNMATAGPQWNEQNFIVPIAGGSTTPISNLSSASQQVIGENKQRSKITFHNPNITSNKNVFVCQAIDASGNALPASPDGAGTFAIFPGASITLEGNAARGAFNACTETGATGQALTIVSAPQ